MVAGLTSGLRPPLGEDASSCGADDALLSPMTLASSTDTPLARDASSSSFGLSRDPVGSTASLQSEFTDGAASVQHSASNPRLPGVVVPGAAAAAASGTAGSGGGSGAGGNAAHDGHAYPYYRGSASSASNYRYPHHGRPGAQVDPRSKGGGSSSSTPSMPRQSPQRPSRLSFGNRSTSSSSVPSRPQANPRYSSPVTGSMQAPGGMAASCAFSQSGTGGSSSGGGGAATPPAPPRRPQSLPNSSTPPVPGQATPPAWTPPLVGATASGAGCSAEPASSGTGNAASQGCGDVSVCVRLRPGPREEMCTFAEGANTIRMRSNPFMGRSRGDMDIAYSCDHAFGPEANQERVYGEAIAPICESVLNGYNGAVIAYGQTGSGKTHTIIGDQQNKGVIPRAIATMFCSLETRQDWYVEVSCIEIYNERARDLLAAGSGMSQVDIHEVMHSDGTSSFQCPDATRRRASTPEDALGALTDGLRRRETARTDMNHNSSRSHLVYTLTAVQNDAALGATLHGRLHMVDLAGSERLKRSMASADVDLSRSPRLRETQRREAGAINKSLTQLALVIFRLTQDTGVKHVPYRDSMVTRLLADSFGGSSKTCLIITCSPLLKDREETRGALEFGRRANLVKNTAQINIELQQEPSDVVKALVAKEVAELNRDREELRHHLRVAVADALRQQRLRVSEVRELEEEKGELQRFWLESAAAAHGLQEESSAELTVMREENMRLEMHMQEMSEELSAMAANKASLTLRLVEALQDAQEAERRSQVVAEVSVSAAASAARQAELLSNAARVAEKGEMLRQNADVEAASAERAARQRSARLKSLDDEAREHRTRWKAVLRASGADGSGSGADGNGVAGGRPAEIESGSCIATGVLAGLADDDELTEASSGYAVPPSPPVADAEDGSFGCASPGASAALDAELEIFGTETDLR
eukprot:TRINITY_DN74723_c0_g1_i1.p1 TRINITY_DN74723_c0_g1~~TRINITY_DN74723_c0_g1_i1.p1  ORF type:complete len:948 (-),score=201.90 TRINITY_DN74723_c0_g1_i1:46-2847(-)